MKNEFWKGMKVLVTGHTGFIGSWLSIWLNELGADVIGYSLRPDTDDDNYVVSRLNERIVDLRGDIRDIEKLQSVFYEYNPQIVFHTEQQSSVKNQPTFIYESYILGTLNILECIRNTDSVKVGIMQSSEKCYDKKEQMWGYRESDRLGGIDIYSASEACTELIISSYFNNYLKEYNRIKKAISSVRIGDTIGGGQWSVGDVVPETIKAIENNKSVILNNAQNVRCWQHILEPVSGMIQLAQRMYEDPINYSESWNFGAECTSCLRIYDIAEKITSELKKDGRLEILELDDIKKDTSSFIALDTTKAKCKLGWKQKWGLDKTIKYTVDWYKEYKQKDMYDLCVSQIERYRLFS